MEKRTIALVVAVILIAGAIVYLQQFTPNKSYVGTPVAPGNRAAINAEKVKIYPYAKEIAEPSGFVNVDNITVGSLIGKDVILVDFWTYSCINCERTIPYLNMWYAEYHDQGLEIIGVHTPEFPFEHDIGNVRRAVNKFGIQYPVVLDNDYTTETEIQSLLRERADALGIQVNISNTTETPADAVSIDFSKVGSPETYFGAARNQYLGNGKQSVNGMQTLVLPVSALPNVLYLGGTWNFTDQYAETAGNDTIVFQYNAKNVYFVASAGDSTNVSVMVDGRPAGDIAGPDVSGNVTTVKDEQLYQLVAGKDYGEHTLELDIPQPGLRAYTFTFG